MPLRLKDEVLGEVLWGMTMNDFPYENTIVIMDALVDAQKRPGSVLSPFLNIAETRVFQVGWELSGPERFVEDVCQAALNGRRRHF